MGACDEKGEGGKAMVMGIRVVGDKEAKGDEAGDGVGDEGGVQQREQLLWRQEQWQRGWQVIDSDKGDGDDTWVMVVVTRLAGNEEGKGEGGKGDGDGDDGDGRRRGNGDGGKSNGDGDNGGGRAMAMATKRVMVMVMATSADHISVLSLFP